MDSEAGRKDIKEDNDDVFVHDLETTSEDFKDAKDTSLDDSVNTGYSEEDIHSRNDIEEKNIEPRRSKRMIQPPKRYGD